MTIRTIPASPAERAYQHALRDQQDAAARVAAVRGALVTLAGGPIRPCRMEINALADNLAAAEAAADLAALVTRRARAPCCVTCLAAHGEHRLAG